MLSHDFAGELLKRRNHDLRFVAEVSLPGHDEDGDLCRTQLIDGRNRAVGLPDGAAVLSYSSEDDVLDVALGPIFAGEQGSYYLSPKEAAEVLHALSKGTVIDPRSPALLKLREALEDAAS